MPEWHDGPARSVHSYSTGVVPGVHSAMASSKGQARKDIEGGGIYLNNIRATEIARFVRKADLLFDKHLLLRKGKRNYTCVTATGVIANG